MKLVIALVVLAVVYLFYPFRDLYVRESPFSDNYQQQGTGFWTASACVEAARAARADDFRCVKHTLWSKMLRTYSQYDPAIREGDAGNF